MSRIEDLGCRALCAKEVEDEANLAIGADLLVPIFSWPMAAVFGAVLIGGAWLFVQTTDESGYYLVGYDSSGHARDATGPFTTPDVARKMATGGAVPTSWFPGDPDDWHGMKLEFRKKHP